MYTAREPLNLNSTVIGGGCSRQVHKIVYLAVNKGNILVNFYFWKYSSRIIITYKSVYLFNKIFVGWVVVATEPELCQKCNFFLKNRMKEIFAYMFLNLCLLSIKCKIPVH